MTAGKNQAQPVVFKAVLKGAILKAVRFMFIRPFRRTRLRFEISHELVLRRIESCPSTQSINSFEPGRRRARFDASQDRSEEHTFELQSPDHLVCRLLLEKKKEAQPSAY